MPWKQSLNSRRIVRVQLGILLGALGLTALMRLLVKSMTAGLEVDTKRPTLSYEEALERLASLQDLDDEQVNPLCQTNLLSHGRKVQQVIVLIHGITNCPQQFVELAPLWYELGYNVLIPRMPRNGLADRMTSELKKLTAEELRDACDSYVDIAHGLGEEVTVLGLSAGGTMVGWIAQHRSDVQQAVLIAPMFGFDYFGPRITVFLMRLLLLLPNIPTQNFFPFQDGPTHSYLGYSTYALVEVMRLAASVYVSAKKKKPAVQSVLLITNACDTAVNNQMSWQLAELWKKQGLQQLETYEFGKEHQLIHDIVDPEQREQQTSLVYPVLLDLISHQGM